MVANPTEKRAIVLDASFVIAICANEPNRHTTALTLLQTEAALGSEFFAPGVAVAESLFAFARKLEDGVIDANQHATAVRALYAIMTAVLPPPKGEASLIIRAESLRVGYSKSHSADSIYLALAEDLSSDRDTEVFMFDLGMKNQATANAPSLVVNRLSP